MKDKDKLALIIEHAREYYKNSREYYFVENGFLSYEIFDTPKGQAVYFSDIFVSKKSRGSKVVKALFDFGRSLHDTHDINIGYCRVEKGNKHKEGLKYMYLKYGFKYESEDEEAIYYKWENHG